MPSRVRCASAASTSACMPPTISATRSASARAACSRSSASRSACRRSRSVVSVMKPETNTSPPASTCETVASPGKRRPSRRTSSTSNVSVASGASLSTSAWRRSSWRSACSGGMISSRIVFPTASSLVQPNMPLGRRVPAW